MLWLLNLKKTIIKPLHFVILSEAKTEEILLHRRQKEIKHWNNMVQMGQVSLMWRIKEELKVEQI